MAPTGPTVQWLALWVGADLTGDGMAPAGPSVQWLALWVGADLTEGQWHRWV
ncbi:hypothetical protein LV75_000921 [Actinokineospora diospyrosa]|uniref:Uncharacterized protein n=1 Tax=Actinokineospora diospyrosa TaxID=103728 RepID=A0ABT1I732_9PSEU|nr:hypothetical protein [Actinokineospora diospyrosa]